MRKWQSMHNRHTLRELQSIAETIFFWKQMLKYLHCPLPRNGFAKHLHFVLRKKESHNLFHNPIWSIQYRNCYCIFCYHTISGGLGRQQFTTFYPEQGWTLKLLWGTMKSQFGSQDVNKASLTEPCKGASCSVLSREACSGIWRQLWSLPQCHINTPRAHSAVPRPVPLKKGWSYLEGGQTPSLPSSSQHGPISSRQQSNTLQTSSSQPQLEIVARNLNFASNRIESASASWDSQMGFLTAEPLIASWTPDEESSQTNTQRKLRRWNLKPSTNFSREFNSSVAKISNVLFASWLAFSGALSNAHLQITLTLSNMCSVLCMHLSFFFMHLRIWALELKT